MQSRKAAKAQAQRTLGVKNLCVLFHCDFALIFRIPDSSVCIHSDKLYIGDYFH